MSKIRLLAELGDLLAALRATGKRVVAYHGVFDLIHPEYIRLLEEARGQGDVLVLTLTPDRLDDQQPGRPMFNERLRAEGAAGLQVVDFVAIDSSESAAERILTLRPDVVVRSSTDLDPTGVVNASTEEEDRAVAAVGGRVYLVADQFRDFRSPGIGSYGRVSEEAAVFLADFRARYAASEVIARIRGLKALKVLVVGDAIIDEYHFCLAYGMASKSSAIAAKFSSAESHAGGSLAIANHLAGFVGEVRLVTCLGTHDAREAFVRERLRENVTLDAVFRDDGPTVVKRRYVHQIRMTKLFEVSFFNDQPLPPSLSRDVASRIDAIVDSYDLVLVADFGHGFITQPVIDLLCRRARFLAVNTQLNAINAGYNVITKYPRADYVCIDQEEVRMACRDRYSPLNDLVRQLVDQLGCRQLTVTRGPAGSATYLAGQGFSSAPALSRDVVDSTGAGDAFLSIAAPCAQQGLPPDLICFLGNAVGAVAVQIVGNRQPVEPERLTSLVGFLL